MNKERFRLCPIEEVCINVLFIFQCSKGAKVICGIHTKQQHRKIKPIKGR
jgi:hypothetical protein